MMSSAFNGDIMGLCPVYCDWVERQFMVQELDAV